MPLNADALIDVEYARRHITGRIPGSDDGTDMRIVDLINSASRAIRLYCEREFTPTPHTSTAPYAADNTAQPVTRRFRYDGEGSVSLAPYELRSLGGPGFGGTGAIVLYSDMPSGSQQTLSVGTVTAQPQYRLGPRQQTIDGTYLWLSLPALRGPRAGSALLGQTDAPSTSFVEGFYPTGLYFEVEVSVSGYWGMAQVPADVQRACAITVANEYRNPEGFQSRAGGALTFTEAPESPDEDENSLPYGARSLLWPYRRRRLRRH